RDGVGVCWVLKRARGAVAEVPGVGEAGGGVDGAGIAGIAAETDGGAGAAVVGAARQCRGRHVVHRHRRGVVGEAAVLVLDAAANRVNAIVVVRVGARRLRHVGQVPRAVVIEVVAVLEAGGGVGARGVGLVAEGDGGGAA